MDEREVIDVDDPDVFCTGVRHCVRIDRLPSPPPRKRCRDPVTISLLDDLDTLAVPPTIPKHGSHSPPVPRPSSSMTPCTELQRITQLELESRKAFHESHPTKRRATDPLKMAATVVSNFHQSKRKAPPEVIEISSDSEPEDWPVKRQKVEEHDADASSSHHVDIPKAESEPILTEPYSPTPSSSCHSDGDDDGDDDCINFLASLDISNEANWIPLPEGNKAEDLTPMHDLDDLPKPHSLPPFHLPQRKPPVEHAHVSRDLLSMGLWGTMSKTCGITRFPKPFYHAQRQDRVFPRRPPSFYHENGYAKFELTAKYPHLTSGAVNKIIQACGTVVLCAVVDGGAEDSDDEDDEDRPPPRPENKLGSLVVYHHGQVYVAPAHCQPRNTSRGSVLKYYTVQDVAFNPHNPRQFLSSGHDLVVQTWEILDNENDQRVGLAPKRSFQFDARPHNLLYNCDGSALAITFVDGTVRLSSQDLFEDMIDADHDFKKLYAAPKGSGHATGSVLWGTGPSEHLLFTSSEPQHQDKDNYSGFHLAFDVHKGEQFQFDAKEAGDAAALSPDGSTLVLFTRGDHSTHPVRLYDVRRKIWQVACETEELEKFYVRPIMGASQDDSEEVNHASFSPDGRLLAVARNDNAVHVYDVRALSRGPLCQFEHHDSDTAGGGGFGIIEANWVQGRTRIGMVTGGNDGCVRLWEPSLGRDSEVQGVVIGRTDFDVGHFSIGDPENGEFPLVIGDAGGGMHTYDFTNPDGDRI